MKIILTNYQAPGMFVFAVLPTLAVTMLPPEEKRSYKVRGDDYRFSLTLGWLFFGVTFCFWRYDR